MKRIVKNTREVFGSCCGIYFSIVLVRVDFSVNINHQKSLKSSLILSHFSNSRNLSQSKASL